MGYTDLDQLAINTIRVLAVCSHLPSASDLPVPEPSRIPWGIGVLRSSGNANGRRLLDLNAMGCRVTVHHCQWQFLHQNLNSLLVLSFSECLPLEIWELLHKAIPCSGSVDIILISWSVGRCHLQG